MASSLVLPNGAPPAPTLYDAIGRPIAPSNDPAWQPPKDPLRAVSLTEQARAISREIPITTIATGWDVPGARLALEDLVIGLFDAPAQLSDAVMRSDSRVQSALNQRLGLLGRPVSFELPEEYQDSDLAKECLRAFRRAWRTIAAEPVMSELQRWAIMLGFGPAQILWDTSGEYAIPHPLPWHPRYTYYHWQYRALVAITMDGQTPIIAGDGHWINHAPHGQYRGWMRGAVSAITPWWLSRAYALRDWSRYSERHGLPMLKAKMPAVGDPNQQASFRAQLHRLGQETVFHLPQFTEPAVSYDVDLLEAKDTAHEGFRMLIAQCNEEITLALNAQTLTTSMPAEGGSSYAAARVHADVRQALLEADARALAETMYEQIARPFAAINFGNPDLAPRVLWDVTPFEDAETKGKAFQLFVSGYYQLRQAGFEMSADDFRGLLNRTIPGLKIGPLKATDPLSIAVAGAKPAPSPGGGEAFGAAPKKDDA